VSNGARPLIVGHSHAGALFEAATAKGLDVDAVSLWREVGAFRHEEGAIVLSDALRERVRSASRIVSTIGGGAYLMATMATIARPFAFVAPWSPDERQEEGVELAPTRAVAEVFRERGATNDALLAEVVSLASAPVVHVVGPPPPRAWEAPHARTNLESLRTKFGEATIARLESAGGRRRLLALWRLTLELAKETCHALSITWMPPPSAACDDEGFLLPEYSHDLVHANAAYGSLVLEQLGLDDRLAERR
jgi:hypothetical protein